MFCRISPAFPKGGSAEQLMRQCAIDCGTSKSYSLNYKIPVKPVGFAFSSRY
jgi:hypothetical protein